jgi:hypothetical protein
MGKICRLAGLAIILLVAACAGPQHRLHYTVLENPDKTLPKKVVLLPADIVVNELTAGGVVEEVPAWSEQARKAISTALSRFASKSHHFENIPLPELSQKEQEKLEAELAFYDVVGGTAYEVTRNPDKAWRHKLAHFDYSIGNGLNFIRQKTGADAGIIVTAVDFVPTAERKAMWVAASAFGASIWMGNPIVFASIVDLETGNILWMNFALEGSYSDLRDQKDADSMIEKLFKLYPGLDKYKVAKK